MMEGSAVFLSVPMPVQARRLFVDSWVDLPAGRRLVPRGFWVLTPTAGTGQVYILPDDHFRHQFRPTDTASETLWNERTDQVYPQWPNGKPIPLS
jgi:hypothetical protein